MYAGKLNKYEINYFVLFFVHMHVLIQCNAHVKIEMYKGKHNEVHYPKEVSPMNAFQYK